MEKHFVEPIWEGRWADFFKNMHEDLSQVSIELLFCFFFSPSSSLIFGSGYFSADFHCAHEPLQVYAWSLSRFGWLEHFQGLVILSKSCSMYVHFFPEIEYRGGRKITSDSKALLFERGKAKVLCSFKN